MTLDVAVDVDDDGDGDDDEMNGNVGDVDDGDGSLEKVRQAKILSLTIHRSHPRMQENIPNPQSVSDLLKLSILLLFLYFSS